MPSRIQYNPSISVKENAKKNGVSVAGIRNYIKVNNIDRRYDRKINLIEDCRKYLKKHPQATRQELSKNTKHSPTTIRQYWDYITTEKELPDFDSEKLKKRQLRQFNNFYATHPSVTQDILNIESFHNKILEPFCGTGTMAKVIQQNGYEVEASDIIDRGYGKQGDFFQINFPAGEYDIISNPPYGEEVGDIIQRCISLCKGKVALLLTLNYLSGKNRYNDIYSKYPPSRVYVYCERITIARDGDFKKYSDAGSNLTNYAWLIWEKGYKGKTELKWLHNGTGDKSDKASTTTKIVKANRYELYSEVLKEIPEMFKKAEQEDISAYRDFITEKPEMPMLFVGSGGMNGALPSLFYGMREGIGKAITPLQFASLSDAAIKNSRILLLSKGGRNDDIVYAAKRAVKLNPDNTACLTFRDTEENRLIKVLAGSNARIILYNHPEIHDGFTSVRGKFYKYGLNYRAYTGIDEFASKLKINLDPESCFKYEINDGSGKPVDFGRIEHFIVLYSGYGEPVAMDFESVMTEAGVASVQVSDYRNYCHGRFIFACNHVENTKEPRATSNTTIILFISPREKSLAKQIRTKVIPAKAPIITVETEHDNALATLDLLVKSNVLLAAIGEQGYGINPYSPPNYSEIDKRVPIGGISFIDELKRNGNLVLSENVSQEEINLKQQIDRFVKEELYNTSRIREFNDCLPYPTRNDLFKKRKEHYDASQHQCIAFRRKEDLHKDIPMPFGNMNGGFGYDMNGVHFHTSESAYICGLFSNNTPEHIAIQKTLVEETNGYAAKKTIRAKNAAIGRADWYDFNVDWMLYCVWQKVNGNAAFKKYLMDIPIGATIIENSTFQARRTNDTAAFWGCRNAEQKEFHKLLKKYAACKGWDKSKIEDYISEQESLICNFGEFIGNNVMGKILMIIKQCLHEGTEPDIDYDLLNSKEIYLLGRPVKFYLNTF